jgi:Ca-activated chloride channel family protein
MRELLILLYSILSIGVPAGAQTVWVTGAVEDSITHNPLPGVTVSVMNDTVKVVTNSYGLFRIVIPSGGTHLLFEHPKYFSHTIAIERYSRMLVSLTPKEKAANDIAIAKAKAKARFAHSSNPNYGNIGMGIQAFFDETYGTIYENKFVETMKSASSNFALDVDRAAYSNIRRFVRLHEPVPADAVRIEEMVNYFHYDYPLPDSNRLLAIHSRYAACPWEPKHNLLQIAVRARQVDIDSLPASNLVFLIDVSGSMGNPNKLPLLQAAFRVLVNNLRPNDRVAIVAYAGTPGVVLPATRGDQKEKILNAIDYLSAGGATAGEAAIKMAYQIAVENYIKDGNNRVILATDGDFNVGQTSDHEMEELIMQKKESGVLLTCLGFGMGDYKDSKLEALSSKGNGNFAYIDNLEEANKIFAREFGSTLFTVAQDAKAQVWFNPAVVKAYRLIGYENKVLKEDNTNGDKVVGGIIGAGHCSVALYEIIRRDSSTASPDSSLGEIKLWYKQPADTTTLTLRYDIPGESTTFEAAPADFRFASSVALLGMLLRKSSYKGLGNATMVMSIAKKSLGPDKGGYRKEFLKLVKELKKSGNVR